MTRTPDRLAELTVEITVPDTSEWSAILDDRNPLHSDPESGDRSGVGHGIVSPGPANIAPLMTLLQRSFPGAMLEHFEARFIAAVFAPGAAIARGVVDREEHTAEGRRLFCSLELLAAGKVAVTAQAQIRLTGRQGQLVHPDHATPTGGSTVYGRFAAQARATPAALALRAGTVSLTYGELLQRVDRCAARLRELAVARGARVAVLSENRPEYTIVQLAAAKLGALVACLNWRLTDDELRDSLGTVEPRVLAYSPRFAATAARLATAATVAHGIEALCGPDGTADAGGEQAQPEDGLLIIFTSGTTGRPRAAVISHRAEIARMRLLQRDFGIDAGDAYVAWSPMFHMGGSEHTLSSLMFGAPVIICDGLDAGAIASALEQFRVGWLLLVPATIEPVLAELQRAQRPIAGLKLVGCMADLVPAATINALCTAVDAPFLNSFGSTETGLPPLSGHLLPPGDPLTDLSKRPNSGCELRLVDASGQDAAVGAVGEAWVRGETLFSGYWRDGGIDRSCFHGDWYPMGDLFRQTPGGGYQFVGRSKYLIKSGGENIYPAEIERVLLDDPRIEDAAVVRRPDDRWGEVPVAFIVRRAHDLHAADVDELCRNALAGYKRPKSVYFIDAAAMPRSETGKIIREELEVLARNH